MKLEKWLVFALVIVLAAFMAVGCGGGADTGNNGGGGNEAAEAPAVTHAIDGAFENCADCHDDLEETHADFSGYEDSCLDCHEAA
jgi:hypothetical protein